MAFNSNLPYQTVQTGNGTYYIQGGITYNNQFIAATPKAAPVLTAINNTQEQFETFLGDQFAISTDPSVFRIGSWPTTPSGDLYNLAGDFLMWYWTHNVAVDANGNFLGRDDAGICTIWAFTEGTGGTANQIAMWTAPTAAAGVKPVWTLIMGQDTAGGTFYGLGGTSAVVGSITSVQNFASNLTATLTNSPVTSNPTKWMQFNDAGVTRYIPMW